MESRPWWNILSGVKLGYCRRVCPCMHGWVCAEDACRVDACACVLIRESCLYEWFCVSVCVCLPVGLYEYAHLHQGVILEWETSLSVSAGPSHKHTQGCKKLQSRGAEPTPLDRVLESTESAWAAFQRTRWPFIKYGWLSLGITHTPGTHTSRMNKHLTASALACMSEAVCVCVCYGLHTSSMCSGLEAIFQHTFHYASLISTL